MEKIAVISFYSFINIEDPEILIPRMLYISKKKSVRGTIIVSYEGFNGSLSGNEQDVNLVLSELYSLTMATDINEKTNYCEIQPFSKIKVKFKDEIVALKTGSLDVNNLKGEYINSEDWDDFISKEDVVLIDTRNDYEVQVGTFEGAINPETETFREFPEWVEKNKALLDNKKIAMYCTGGIRCEKSTAYLKKMGYNDVYHLKGGILQYLDDTENMSGKWQGSCFVFDDRGAVSENLLPSDGYWVERGYSARSHATMLLKSDKID